MHFSISVMPENVAGNHFLKILSSHCSECLLKMRLLQGDFLVWEHEKVTWTHIRWVCSKTGISLLARHWFTVVVVWEGTLSWFRLHLFGQRFGPKIAAINIPKFEGRMLIDSIEFFSWGPWHFVVGHTERPIVSSPLFFPHEIRFFLQSWWKVWENFPPFFFFTNRTLLQ
jgi:hypothetical protein